MVNADSSATLQLRLSESALVTVSSGAAPAAGQDVVGYYAVTPEGALGVAVDQWLQVDCRTRQALGVVKAGT
jgi:hypothetical protein